MTFLCVSYLETFQRKACAGILNKAVDGTPVTIPSSITTVLDLISVVRLAIEEDRVARVWLVVGAIVVIIILLFELR